MGPAGPAEVPGAGSVSLGRTQLDRLLRVIPKPATVSMNQLRLAASTAGQDQVCAYGSGVCVESLKDIQLVNPLLWWPPPPMLIASNKPAFGLCTSRYQRSIKQQWWCLLHHQCC